MLAAGSCYGGYPEEALRSHINVLPDSKYAFRRVTNECLPVSQVFLRSSLLLVVADSPQRALMLGCKHPNKKTKHPCSMCLVEQSKGDGGELGDGGILSRAPKRTRETMEGAWHELQELIDEGGASKVVNRTSMELGVVVPDRLGLQRPLFDLVTLGNPNDHVPPERLHADALVSGIRCLSPVKCIRVHNIDFCVHYDWQPSGIH